MAVIPYMEKNHRLVDIKAIYKWTLKKFGIVQDRGFTKSKDKDGKTNQSKYLFTRVSNTPRPSGTPLSRGDLPKKVPSREGI